MTYKPEDVLKGNFLKYISEERRFSPYTKRNYAHAIEVFFTWMREKEKWNGSLESITKQHLRSFIIEFQNTHKRRTLHNWVSGLRMFFNYLIKNKKLENNPWTGITLPKLDKPLPLFLTEKQMIDLLSGPMHLLENKSIEPFEAWRDHLMLELLYGGGLRVSELVSLNYGDIDFSNGVARIVGKGSKERRCPLGKIALECLGNYKKQFANDTSINSPILLSNKKIRLTPRQVQLTLKKYLALAGLPKDLTPHKIRHSYATHLLNNGANLRVVQELLGHSSLSTTQIYTHVDLKRLKEVHQFAHPRS